MKDPFGPKPRSGKTIISALCSYATDNDVIILCGVLGSMSDTMIKQFDYGFKRVPDNCFQSLLDRELLKKPVRDDALHGAIYLALRDGRYLTLVPGAFLSSALVDVIPTEDTIFFAFDQFGNPVERISNRGLFSKRGGAHIVFAVEGKNPSPYDIKAFFSVEAVTKPPIYKGLFRRQAFALVCLGEGAPIIPTEYIYPKFSESPRRSQYSYTLDKLRSRNDMLFDAILTRANPDVVDIFKIGARSQIPIIDTMWMLQTMFESNMDTLSPPYDCILTEDKKDVILDANYGIRFQDEREGFEVALIEVIDEYIKNEELMLMLGSDSSEPTMHPLGTEEKADLLKVYDTRSHRTLAFKLSAATIPLSFERCWIDTIQGLALGSSMGGLLSGGMSSSAFNAIASCNHVESICNYAPMVMQDDDIPKSNAKMDPFLRFFKTGGYTSGTIYARHVNFDEPGFLLGPDQEGQSLAWTSRTDGTGRRTQKYLFYERTEDETSVDVRRIFGLERWIEMKRYKMGWSVKTYEYGQVGGYSGPFDDKLKIPDDQASEWKPITMGSEAASENVAQYKSWNSGVKKTKIPLPMISENVGTDIQTDLDSSDDGMDISEPINSSVPPFPAPNKMINKFG